MNWQSYECFLLLILVIASVTDIGSQRIPNWLSLSAMVFGLGWNAGLFGLHGFLWSFAGLLLGMAFLMVFYVLGGTGAGDVKLMGAAGAFLGPWGVFVAFICTTIAGGIYAIAIILFHSRLRPMRIALVTTITGCLCAGKFIYDKPVITGGYPRLCYGVAIAVGTIASIFIS